MTINFPCSNCGKRFSVPDKMVGMQAKCTCGTAMTIPAESEPEPQAAAEVQPADLAPAATGYVAPARQPVYGRAFDAGDAYAMGAGVLGTIFVFPTYQIVKAAYNAIRLLGTDVFRAELLFVSLISFLWTMGSIGVVVGGVSLLFRQEWGLVIGAISGYVMFAALMLMLLYVYIQLLQAGVFPALGGLRGWLVLTKYELIFLCAPAAMIAAYHFNARSDAS